MTQGNNLYIGLMSGTSADGVDVALVDFDNNGNITLLNSEYLPYDDHTKRKITSLYTPGDNEIDRAGALGIELANLFSSAVMNLLTKASLSPKDINAIGSHGQTVRHRPKGDYPFTLQIGCNQSLAVTTGIRVIGDFRTKDMALGGQGAPLVPAFHQQYFRSNTADTFVVNIGGISNLTYLPKDTTKQIVGYDTGPGNALMDDWYQAHHSDRSYDQNGLWASSGNVNSALLSAMKADPYFQMPNPKSTGREYFHPAWIQKHIAQQPATPADIQATLAQLTADTLTDQILALSECGEVYLCGGGYRNTYLVDLIKKNLPEHNISLTNQKDICPDMLESMAFAWLAFAYDKKLYSNIPAVTGAREETVLGCAFFS